MRRLLPIGVSAFFLIVTGNADAAATPAINNQGWTITADPDRNVLSISQQDLGVVLQDVRMNLADPNGVQPLTGWSVEQTSQSQLTIHTVHPATTWNLSVGRDMLTISSTATNAVLTAQAPASSDRIPARTLDPQGFPVDWMGTDEAPIEYGGRETHNQS